MKTYKVIKIKGATAYERGVQYGQQAKTEIDIAVAFYKKKFEKKFTWSQIIEYAQKFEKVSTEFYPEAVEEMHGIADGSGYTIEEIIAVNARYEISQFDWQKECTTGVFLNPEKKKKFIFKNCDLGRDVENHLVILDVTKPDGFHAIGVAEAGQLIRDGYNSCGVALVNSALRSGIDGAGVAVPGTIIRQKVWDSSEFETACQIQRGMYRTVSTNMLIGGKSGCAVDFECYPGGEDEVFPQNGLIGTGNRFTIHPERNRAIDPAIDRGLQLKKLLEKNREEMDVETIKRILSNHEGYPESICRHADEIGHSTVYSIIIDMTEDIVFICAGNPCCGEYQEYRV